MAHPVLVALHALSGDPALAEARQLLIKQSSDTTLEGVIRECLARNNSREVREGIASFLLDAGVPQNQPRMHDDLVAVEGPEQQRTAEGYLAVKEEGTEDAHSWSRVHINQERYDVQANNTTRMTGEVDVGFMANDYFAMDAHERELGSRKHRISGTPHMLGKRARTSRTASIDAEPAHIKRESPDSLEERTSNSASENIEELERSAFPYTISIQAIPKVKVVFGYPTDGMFRPIDYAPPQVGNHLLRRLKLDYGFDANDQAAYNRILQFGQPPQCYDRCLNTLNSGTSRCTWMASNRKERYACDFCIRTGRICARIPRGEASKIAVYSMPSHLRSRIKAVELEYWLQEPQKAEPWKTKKLLTRT